MKEGKEGVEQREEKEKKKGGRRIVVVNGRGKECLPFKKEGQNTTLTRLAHVNGSEGKKGGVPRRRGREKKGGEKRSCFIGKPWDHVTITALS